mgnify:CR=1 FL=1
MKKKIKYLSVILTFVIMIVNSLPGSMAEVNASDLENVSEGSIAGALSETGDGLTVTPTVPEDVTVEMGGDDSTLHETGLWTAVISFNLNGGEDLTGELVKGIEIEAVAETGGYSNSIQCWLPKVTPTKVGFAFEGWSCDNGIVSSGTDGDYVVVTSDKPQVALTAQWRENGPWTAVISFDLNGGEDPNGILGKGVTIEVQGSDTAGTSDNVIYYLTQIGEIPRKEYYVFDYWSCDSEIITSEEAGQYVNITRDDPEIKFTANWKALPSVKVTYDRYDDSKDTTTDIQQNFVDVEGFGIILREVSEREGYKFLGWDCQVNGQPYSDMPLNANEELFFGWADFQNGGSITFVELWEELPKVNVKYVSDGETVLEKPVYMTDDTVFNLTVTDMVPTKDYSRFNGWLWEKNNSLYGSNNLIENLSWEEFRDKTTTFTAQWIELPSVNIEFARHDGEVVTSSEQQKTVDVKNLSIELPVDDSEYVDYKFVGWKCSIDDTTYGVDDIPVFLWEKLADGETITFTSVWEELASVTLEYIRHDGKIVTETVQETAGEDAFMVEMPVDDSEYSGFKYVGWKHKIDDGEYSEDIWISRRFTWDELEGVKKITFESQWIPIVTVKYMNGETEFSSYDILQETGADSFQINIPEGTPQEMYFKFAGWTCDIDEEETIYEAGDVLSDLKWETYGSKTITFTAQWEWDNESILEAAKYSLTAGNLYYLTEGTWTVNEDGYNYTGGISFSVSEDGDYTFKKN